MRKAVIALVLLLAGTVTTIATGLGPAGALEGCNVPWGSLPKTATPKTPTGPSALITNLRAGRHACFDRLVVVVAGNAPSAQVRYVPKVIEDGSGNTLTLRGGAFLEVIVHAPAHDADSRPTYQPANPSEAVNVAGFRTFRQVAWSGTFEGQSLVGLGVRARLPFRVSTWQSSPTTAVVVLDVAHGW